MSNNIKQDKYPIQTRILALPKPEWHQQICDYILSSLQSALPDKFSDLAFSGGHHVCVGQWLARIEIDAMFKEILTRMKNIRLVGEPSWLESNFLFGFKEMYITFDKA